MSGSRGISNASLRRDSAFSGASWRTTTSLTIFGSAIALSRGTRRQRPRVDGARRLHRLAGARVLEARNDLGLAVLPARQRGLEPRSVVAPRRSRLEVRPSRLGALACALRDD